MARALRVAAAADLKSESDQAVQGHDRAPGLVGRPEHAAARGAVPCVGRQVHGPIRLRPSTPSRHSEAPGSGEGSRSKGQADGNQLGSAALEKRGYQGSSHDLPALSRIGPVRRISAQDGPEHGGDVPPGSGLLPLPVVWHGHGPLGRDPRAVAAGVDARCQGTGLRRRSRWTASARPPTWCSRSWPACTSRNRPWSGPARRSATRSAGGVAAGETFGASDALVLAQGRRGEDLRLRLARPHRAWECKAPTARRPRAGWPRWGWSTTRCPRTPPQWARPQGRTPQFQARYVAGLEGQASLGEPMRKQAAQVGMDQAERWIALSDAGAGVEDWLRTNFGRVEAVILDFYHAYGTPRATWPGRCIRATNRRERSGSTSGATA